MSLVGQTLRKYRVLEEIGRGGMAFVYKAHDPDLDRTVALKVLAPQLAWDDEFIKRFYREARSAARLTHPGIVTLFDMGKAGEYHYIAMEYLEGQNLATVIRQEGRLALPDIIRIVSQVSSALDYAHGKGLLHRDVKPENIAVDAENRATLMDFGIVKAIEGTRLTRTGMLVGTPQYMSPEQVKGEELTPATDTYSLGLVTYEMLAGRVPFDSTTPHVVLLAQLNEDPPPPRQFNPGLPSAVETVVLRALDKDANRRWPTAGALARALAQSATEPLDNATRLLDWRQPVEVEKKTGEQDPPSAGAPIPSLPVASGSSPNFKTASLVQTLKGHVRWVLAVAVSPNGEVIASGGLDSHIVLWHATEGEVLKQLFGHKAAITSLSFSPDGTLLAAASQDHKIRLWHLPDGSPTQVLEGHRGSVDSVTFSPDGSLLASGSEDGTVRSWNPSRGVLVKEIEGHPDGVRAIAISPNGDVVAAVLRNGWLRFSRLSDGVTIRTLTPHDRSPKCLAYSPDGALLAIGTRDHSVGLWRIASSTLLAELLGHNGAVHCVAFSPDGSTLASAAHDGTVRLWGTAEGDHLSTLTEHTGPVNSVVFTPDGRHLVSGSDDHTVRIWRVH